MRPRSRRFYLSRFPPAECRRRVEAVTKPDSFYNRCFADPSGSGVLATFSETGFRLFYFGGLGFPQVLYGEFVPTPDGSVIETQVRSYPQSWIFPVIFLTALLLLGGRDWFWACSNF